jgi:hypothetical protein
MAVLDGCTRTGRLARSAREADAELRKAVEFYRGVGATFYFDRAEALRVKSA